MYGPVGLHDLRQRLVNPSRIGARWWATVLLLYPALAVVAAALAWRATTEPLDLAAAAARLSNPIGLAAMMGFILIIVIGRCPKRSAGPGTCSTGYSSDGTRSRRASSSP